jgi:virginiamycin A acetyltransferase
LRAVRRWQHKLRRSLRGSARRKSDRISKTVKLPKGSRVTWRTTIEPHTSFSGPLVVRGVGEVSFGRWNAVGEELRIVSSDHDMSVASMNIAQLDLLGLEQRHVVRSPVRVDNATWIGDRVTLLSGAHVRDGAVIGAGSVVRAEVPPFTVAAGVPARVVRPRFGPEVQELLQELAWWDWPIERILRNREFFSIDLTRSTVDVILSSVVP